MKIERTEVYGFRAALRGMRNPKESWARSDTTFEQGLQWAWDSQLIICLESPSIGPEDLKLACGLIKAGSDHRKFLRQIIITTDFTLPIDVWSELDTYKVSTVRNSCSTMHKLGSRDLTVYDFENEDVKLSYLAELNAMGLAHRSKVEFVDPDNGRAYGGLMLLEHMKHRLPSGYLQKATYEMSYETAFNMYHARKAHRLPQWSGPDGICYWIKTLPYMDKFLGLLAG